MIHKGWKYHTEEDVILAILKKEHPELDVTKEDLTFVGQSKEDRADYDAAVREAKANDKSK